KYFLAPGGRHAMCRSGRSGAWVGVEVDSGQEVAEVPNFDFRSSSRSSAGAFSADGGIWVSVTASEWRNEGNALARSWDLETGRAGLRSQLEGAWGDNLAVAVSPGAKLLAVVPRKYHSNEGGALSVYDGTTGKRLIEKQLGKGRVTEAAFSRDGGL